MKALVIHDCATSAYVRGLKAYFPEWEVRGVYFPWARKWLDPTSPKADFVGYIQQTDIYVGPSLEGTMHGPLLPAHVQHVNIPGFAFRGLHPDCFKLAGFESVLGPGGNLYSKLVIAAFQAGLAPAQARDLFTESMYEKFGFPNLFEPELVELIRKYDEVDIDIANSFEKWLSRGNFLYSYNHPRIDVFMDILRLALVVHALLPVSERDRERAWEIQDDLSDSIVWPVYPEIASRHGLQGSLQWRMGRAQNYKTLDLGEFVEATFSALAAKPLPRIANAPAWNAMLDPSLLGSSR